MHLFLVLSSGLSPCPNSAPESMPISSPLFPKWRHCYTHVLVRLIVIVSSLSRMYFSTSWWPSCASRVHRWSYTKCIHFTSSTRGYHAPHAINCSWLQWVTPSTNSPTTVLRLWDRLQRVVNRSDLFFSRS